MTIDRIFIRKAVQSGNDEEVWRSTEEGKHFKIESETGEIKAGFGGKLNGQKIKPKAGKLNAEQKASLEKTKADFKNRSDEEIKRGYGNVSKRLEREKQWVEGYKTMPKSYQESLKQQYEYHQSQIAPLEADVKAFAEEMERREKNPKPQKPNETKAEQKPLGYKEFPNIQTKVNGPQGTMNFVYEWLDKHPDEAQAVENEAKQYEDVLDRVKNFAKEHPEVQYQTFDPETGSVFDVNEGYCVTFHQNHTTDDPYADYSPKKYALMCAIAKKELGSKGVYIGSYGNPEVSFNCPDLDTAKRFAVEHNQHSVYDAAKGETLVNPYHNMETNPVLLDD